MVSIVTPLINQVLNDLDNGVFAFENNTFQRNYKSGLTNLCGLYLIVNNKSKKIYLGGSTNLALRKADYKRNFTDPKRSLKVYSSMRDDLQNYGAESFFFVPLFVFSRDNVCFTQQNVTENQQLKNFFDLHLENALLTIFISETSQHKTRFYNKITIGAFQPNNQLGGSSSSGQASRPLRLKNIYAWESVSAAANSLLVDRCSIRNLIDSGKLVSISLTEFSTFTGTKITNSDAESFFIKPENKNKLQQLRSSAELNLRSNKRFQEFLIQSSLGNGEP